MPRQLSAWFLATVFAACALLWGLAPTPQADEGGAQRAVVLRVDGVIGPASEDFIVRGIEDAEQTGASVVVLQLNTPGGLDTAMRNIIRRILASEAPVVTYVAPPGSRAASAGTYIVYASHVAAMAPATNLGSATPVSMTPGGLGDDQPRPDKGRSEPGDEAQPPPDEDATTAPGTAMERKIVNDAVAYIKGLARLRGRNEQWAEEAVRSAVNLTAQDALQRGVIEFVASDVVDLLTQIDGRTVEVAGAPVVLVTDGLPIETVEPDWRTRFLDVITRPNVAYVMMFLGIYGLFFELSNPGAVFPGVIGAIFLLLALYAFQVLPVNYAGLALIVLGMAFMVGEMFVPSFGVLGIGGGIAFVVGSLILMETEVEAYQISLPLILAATAVSGFFVFTLITLAIRQRARPVVSGREQMIGSLGTATSDFDTEGYVRIHGELWAARTPTRPVVEGQTVRVREIDGLTLVVEPDEENA